MGAIGAQYERDERDMIALALIPRSRHAVSALRAHRELVKARYELDMGAI